MLLVSKFFEHHPFTQEDVSSEGTTPISDAYPSLPPSDSTGWGFSFLFQSYKIPVRSQTITAADHHWHKYTFFPMKTMNLHLPYFFLVLYATTLCPRPSPYPFHQVSGPVKRTTETNSASGTVHPQPPMSISIPSSLSILMWVCWPAASLSLVLL